MAYSNFSGIWKFILIKKMEITNTPYQALFQSYKLGLVERTGCFSTTVVSPGLDCKNRITLSAMTRGRCGKDLVPTDLHAEYYS